MDNQQDFFPQWYKCEQCGLLQPVKLPKDCSTLFALNHLKADHAKHSPSCEWNLNNIIIYTEPTLALRELNKKAERQHYEQEKEQKDDSKEPSPQS